MNFYSQHAEDKLLAKIFPQFNGVCVEVGANDGVTFSTSKHFEEKGWSCVLVEPTPSLCALIRKNRRAMLFDCAASATEGETEFNLAQGHELYSSIESNSTMAREIEQLNVAITKIRVKTRKLDDILAEAGISAIDFMTIDVEGHERAVLEGFSLNVWKPKIVIIEDATDLNETPVSMHMRECGYLRFYRSGGNDWYAVRDSKIFAMLSKQLILGRLTLTGLLKAWLPERARRWLLQSLRKLRSA